MSSDVTCKITRRPVITTDQVLDAIRVLGFDPDEVMSLTIDHGQVTVRIVAHDMEGNIFHSPGADAVATASLVIPFKTHPYGVTEDER